MMMAQCSDWCLQAVVRGSSNIDSKSCNFSLLDFQESEYLTLAEMKMEAVSDELEDFYKPFYPVNGQNTVMASSISFPKEPKEEQREEIFQEQQGRINESFALNMAGAPYVPKYKKRKNEQKRVVLHLPADEYLSSDKWAWRKYGQKPIKGSPYPRSYYRCSSSKGCLARKQVEQSCTEQGNFIVTYTAEHNHSQPTRRNSLAGTIKSKFPTSKSPVNSGSPKMVQPKISSPQYGSTSDLILSPATLLNVHKDEFPEIEINQENIIIGDYHEEIRMFEVSDENECVSIQDMFDGDFFAGLEDIDGFNSSFGCNISISPFS